MRDRNARRTPVNTDAPWPDLDEAVRRVLGIQTKLHQWATDDPHRRDRDERVGLRVYRLTVPTSAGRERSAGVLVAGERGAQLVKRDSAADRRASLASGCKPPGGKPEQRLGRERQLSHRRPA